MRWSRGLKVAGITLAALLGLVVVAHYALGRLVSQADQVTVRATTAVPAMTPRFGDYWDALEELETGAARDLATTADERAFVDAIEQVLLARLEAASAQLDRLRTSAEDGRIREAATSVLGEILSLRGAWATLARLADAESSHGRDGVPRQAIVAFARALRDQPAERVLFPERPIRVKSDRIATGSPRIEVVVNGCRRRFVVDTGAAVSVVGSHVAAACGIEPLGDAATAATSVSEPVRFRPGLVRELQIGTWRIENHPVAILDAADLEFGLAGLPLIKIDGIIGWTLLRDAVFEFDDSGWTTIRRSVPREVPERNFCWLGYPLVVLRGTDGRRLNFGLDTGAAGTSIRRRLLHKQDLGPGEPSRGISLGAGGREAVSRLRFRDVTFLLDDHALHFDRISTTDGVKGAVLWAPDGRLGINVMLAGRTVLDYRNGRFELMR